MGKYQHPHDIVKEGSERLYSFFTCNIWLPFDYFDRDV